MKKWYALLVPIFCLAIAAQAQPTIDGQINGLSEGYELLGSTTFGNNGFGGDNDLGSLYFQFVDTTLYFGLTGEIGSNNQIVFFFDVSSYDGIDAGAALPGAGSTVFNGIAGTRMDMDTDFGMAFNEGNSSTNFYVDAIRYGSSSTLNVGYLGTTINQTGTAASVNTASVFGGTGNLTFAYRSDFSSNSNSGLEFSLPFSALPTTTNTSTIRVFVGITNVGGYWSNEFLPDLQTWGGNFENDPNFDAAAGGSRVFYFNSGALPVELSSFEARVAGAGVQLAWTTASEQQNSHFEVERSLNGSDWATLGRVAGAGNSVTQQAYAYTDAQPANGTNYYRLRQVDLNGNFEYSHIISVELGKGADFRVSPNPTKGNAQILFSEVPAEAVVSISTATGQIVKSYRMAQPSSSENLDLSDLPAGLYLLSISIDGQAPSVQKVLKN